jgi:release factor glutamine methyltransferase
MRASDALARAVPRLAAAGVTDPVRDARLLLAFALAIPPARLILALPEPLAEDVQSRFDALIDRRAARVPLSHLTGERLFWGRSFHVTGAVLDPRPETETLIAEALSRPFRRVLDLGTGSGCILLSLLAERPAATGVGTDLSEEALAVARINRARLDLEVRARFHRGDWFAALPSQDRFDLIVSNPPYIAAHEMAGLSPELRLYEPRGALTDDGDGLAAYRAIARGAGGRLARHGRLLLEIGPTQADAVAALCVEQGLTVAKLARDMDGRPRVVCAEASDAGPRDR